MKNWKLLLHPFARYSEQKLILFGLLAYLIGSALAFAFHVRFDNFLHMASVSHIKWFHPFLDNLIILGVLFVLLFAIGKSLNAKTRAVDILATVLVGNAPFYLMSLTNINGATTKASADLLAFASQKTDTLPSGSLFFLVVTGGLGLVILAWVVALLYNGFKVASHAKGGMAIFLFILVLIAATVLTFLIPLT